MVHRTDKEKQLILEVLLYLKKEKLRFGTLVDQIKTRFPQMNPGLMDLLKNGMLDNFLR